MDFDEYTLSWNGLTIHCQPGACIVRGLHHQQMTKPPASGGGPQEHHGRHWVINLPMHVVMRFNL